MKSTVPFRACIKDWQRLVWGIVLFFINIYPLQAQRLPIASPRSDTVRVAVWPLQYTGLVEREADLIWASGLRVMLNALLDVHPQIRTNDRVKLEEVLRFAQLNRFGVEVPLETSKVEGADYIVMGQYFMSGGQHFGLLEFRMFAVENGAIIAQRHLNIPRLSVDRVSSFLLQFVQQVTQQLNLAAFTIKDTELLPCKSKGMRLFAEAVALREAAGFLEDAQAVLQKYDAAIELYEKSRPYFCKYALLDEELAPIRQARSGLKKVLE